MRALLALPARHLSLAPIDLTALGLPLRDESSAAGRLLLLTLAQRSPYIRLDDGDGSRLDAKRAAELRRRRRLLEREGSVRVSIDDGSENSTRPVSLDLDGAGR